MIRSQTLFDQEAAAFVSAVQRSKEDTTQCLATWTLSISQANNCAAELLCSCHRVHSPVRIPERYDQTNDVDDCDDQYVDDCYDPYVDDTIAVEEDVTNRLQSYGDVGAEIFGWHFSVVYSDTFQCPILFFRVESVDGTIVTSRDLIVQMLISQHHQNFVEDTWDFVSIDEHPIHRAPYFFLHPCQTQERMQILNKPRQQRDTSDPSGLYLLSWMSMILPAVGMPLPSKSFVSIREQLFVAESVQPSVGNGDDDVSEKDDDSKLKST